MKAKPGYLTSGHSARFNAQSVVNTYLYRLPYPVEIFDILAGLSVDEPGRLLDIGTGPGVIARAMLSRIDKVDAVDVSAAMIRRGKTLPGGDDSNLQWICGAIEEVVVFP